MSYRYMRVIVFFDLPVTELAERKAYSDFRKYLVKSGFLMMQESVYCKLALNAVAANAIIKNVRMKCPAKGLVQLLMITEKQYSAIEYIIGGNTSEVIDSPERLIVL